MTTLLVTGAAGFIGSHFVRHWVHAHPDDRVVALDALTYAGTETNLTEVRAAIAFVHADIGDQQAVEDALRAHGVDVVVNFAAESHNSLAVLDPGRFFRTNVLGTQTLLEATRQVGVARFHHVSTCEVYGDLPLDASAGDLCADALGDKLVLLMKNHGPIVIGETIAKTFQTLYYLDRVVNVQMRAFSTGRPVQTIADEIAGKHGPFFREHYLTEEADMHFAAIRRMLDRRSEDYAQ